MRSTSRVRASICLIHAASAHLAGCSPLRSVGHVQYPASCPRSASSLYRTQQGLEVGPTVFFVFYGILFFAKRTHFLGVLRGRELPKRRCSVCSAFARRPLFGKVTPTERGRRSSCGAPSPSPKYGGDSDEDGQLPLIWTSYSQRERNRGAQGQGTAEHNCSQVIAVLFLDSCIGDTWCRERHCIFKQD